PQHVLQRHRMGFRRVAADLEDRPRIVQVVIAVGHRAVAPGVGYAGDCRRVADARLMVDVVGTPIGGELADQVGLLVAVFGRSQPIDGIRTGGLADLQHLVANFIDGLIPRNPLPLAIDQLDRVLQPPLAMRILAHRSTLGAMRAKIEGAVPPRFLADPDTILDLGENGAADRTVSADRFPDFDLAVGLLSFRLADPAEGNGRSSCDTTRRQTGTLQEGTAIHGATDQTGKGLGQTGP